MKQTNHDKAQYLNGFMDGLVTVTDIAMAIGEESKKFKTLQQYDYALGAMLTAIKNINQSTMDAIQKLLDDIEKEKQDNGLGKSSE